MTGIFYFSATGNSLFIAEKLQCKLRCDLKYIPSYAGDGAEYDKIIIVSPIYSFGLPTFVYDLLPRLNKKSELIIVLNYGGMKGGADYLAYEYAKKCGLNIKSVYALKMTENFTLTFTVPAFYINSALKKAEGRTQEVALAILRKEYMIPKKQKTREKQYIKNKADWHIIGERFSVTKDCVNCGKCVNICPVGNIAVKNGKIIFGNKCAACLACYHRCPQKAIVYLNRKKRDRYINPYIKEKDIGKNFSIMERIQSMGLSFYGEIKNVIYLPDGLKRFVIIKSDKGFYTYVYEVFIPADEDDYYDLSPGRWEDKTPYKSVLASLEDAENEIRKLLSADNFNEYSPDEN